MVIQRRPAIDTPGSVGESGFPLLPKSVDLCFSLSLLLRMNPNMFPVKLSFREARVRLFDAEGGEEEVVTFAELRRLCHSSLDNDDAAGGGRGVRDSTSSEGKGGTTDTASSSKREKRSLVGDVVAPAVEGLFNARDAWVFLDFGDSVAEG